jgi:predicted ATPase/DNA-binding XRE family transcriptional regulator
MTNSAATSRPFSDLLRDHRLQRGFSQEYLAEKAGVSVEAISSLERGARKAPYRSTLVQISEALGLSDEESREIHAAAARVRGRVHDPSRPRPASNNLPAQLSTLVGRSRDVVDVLEAVKRHRLVSLIGAGGIGKTRVAIEVGEHLLDGVFDGVWFVDLAPLNDPPSLVSTTVLAALGLPETSGRTPLETICGNLRNKHSLLILDNCEHIIDAAARVTDAILGQCSRVHILTTSHQALAIAGERIVRLPTLSVPDERLVNLTATQALEHGAIALFVDRASDASTAFQFTNDIVPAVTEICRRLDGIPLAIELAAARVSILSADTLAEKLNELFLTLAGGKRTAPTRHRTIRTLLDWSYNLLEANEQEALRKLSVFVGGFSFELAAALCFPDPAQGDTATLNLLASLAEKSLVQCDAQHGTMRYRLLESTRQYARDKLRECREAQDSSRTHALAILSLVERFSILDFVSDLSWKTQAQPEIENWRAAMVWSFGPDGDLCIGQRLAAALNDLWFSRMATEGRRWVCHAIATCNEATPVAIRAKLELAHVIMTYPLGHSQTNATLESLERALKLYEEATDQLGVAACQLFIAERLLFKGRLVESEKMLQQVLLTADAGGAKRLAAMATRCLGIAKGIAGDVEAARRLIRRSLEFYREGGATSNERAIRGLNLAEFEFQAGNVTTALQMALDAIETHREYNASFSLCIVLNNAAAYAVALRRLDEARAYTLEALALAIDGDFDVQFVWALQHLAAILTFRADGARSEALSDLRRASAVLGFVDRRLDELERERGFTERQEYEMVLRDLRAELGSTLDSIIREGAMWSKAQALGQLELA